MIRPNGVEKQVRPSYKPGIYYNSGLGLISLSSDGSSWITIADKNLGAVNVLDYGAFYQWGNNYGFGNSSQGQHNRTVDTTGYGPGNYYSSSTFLTGNRDWSSPSNDNLWGGTTGTVTAMQGPCASGYHVPSEPEMTNLIDVAKTLGAVTTGATIVTYLKMPYGGYITNDGGTYGLSGGYGFYWTTTGNGSKAKFLQFDSGNIWYGSGQEWWKTMGARIRPFKNEATIPDDTRTVLYQQN